MVTKEEIKEILKSEAVHKYCFMWDNLTNKLFEEVEKSYNEGYSSGKNESKLVEKAAESLSE